MNLRRLIKNAEKQVRTGRIRATACLRELAVLRSALNLPRNDFFSLHNSADDGVELRLVEAEQSFVRKLPHMPGEAAPHWIFRTECQGTFPASFVAAFTRGRFWGYYGGSVFTEDGRLVPELSKDVWGEGLHSALLRARLPKPQRLTGSTLSLVTPEAAGNYHHWTVDLLPRAGLAIRAGYKLQEFDHVLIKDRGLPYQLEGLRRLGIDEGKIIRVTDDLHVQADHLVVPSVRHDNTRVGPGDLRFTRSLYLPQEPTPAAARRRLYISRRDASFRRVSNEAEIMPLLHERGFEEVAMSKLSVAEQAKLFSEAAVLVGPNGSALANLAFANPACRVIEFFAPGWVVGYNWMLSELVGLDYTAIIGEGARPPEGTLPCEVKQDIRLDVTKLKAVLDLLPAFTA
jgi:capsular polysaccharide biosynthesis protein